MGDYKNKNSKSEGLVSVKTGLLVVGAVAAVTVVSNIPDSNDYTVNHSRTTYERSATNEFEANTDSYNYESASSSKYEKPGVFEVIFGSFMPNKETNRFRTISISDNNGDTQGETKVVSIPVNDKQLEFINKLKDCAIENYREYKILPSVTIGQAILESNWGESGLSKKHNNYFGIKPGSKWTGKVTVMTTKENYNDVIKDGFRAYDSMEESIKDHGKFLYERSIYKQIFNESTYQGQAQALEDAGYATTIDKNGNRIYADKIINIIETYNLNTIDLAVM